MPLFQSNLQPPLSHQRTLLFIIVINPRPLTPPLFSRIIQSKPLSPLTLALPTLLRISNHLINTKRIPIIAFKLDRTLPGLSSPSTSQND